MNKQAQSPDDVPDSFIQCRAFRHERKRFITDSATTDLGGEIIEFKRTMECENCGTLIVTTYSVPDFRVTKRHYDKPDMYGVKGGFSVYEARMKYLRNRQ